MKVQVLYFQGCPGWQVTLDRLRAVLPAVGRPEVEVDLVRVESAGEAGFAGSPTVLVDGTDLFPGAGAVRELACRLYSTPDGLRGSPTLEALTVALSGRAQQGEGATPCRSPTPAAAPGLRWCS